MVCWACAGKLEGIARKTIVITFLAARNFGTEILRGVLPFGEGISSSHIITRIHNVVNDTLRSRKK